MSAEVQVSQRARDAAADLYLALDEDITPEVMFEAEAIRSGRRDYIPGIQAFVQFEAESARLIAMAVGVIDVAVAASDVFLDGGDMAAIEAFEDWLPKARTTLAALRAQAPAEIGEK